MTIQSYEPSTDFILAASVRGADHPWPGATVWMTGLLGSGKVTLAAEIMRLLTGTGRTACVLDSVHLQLGLNTDVGFSRHGHAERVRRIAELARLFAETGVVAIVADISPYRADRAVAMKIHRRRPEMSFLEVFVDTGMNVQEARSRGQTMGIGEIDAAYEPPDDPHVVLKPNQGDTSAMARHTLNIMGRWM